MPVFGGRRQDAQHSFRPQRDARVPARADADLSATGDARRALGWSSRGGRVDREFRDDGAVPPRLGQPPAPVPPARGDARDAHVPRRRQDRLRGRLLQVYRPVHGRAAGPEAPPVEDGGDEGPEVVRRRGRDCRRPAPRPLLLARGLRLRDRPRQDRRRAAGATGRISTWAPGSCPLSPTTRRPPSVPRGSWSRSTSRRCRPSSSPATASTRRSCSRCSTHSPPATSPGRSTCSARNWRTSCRWRGRRRSVPNRSGGDILPSGINHVVLALADAPLVELFSGQSVLASRGSPISSG